MNEILFVINLITPNFFILIFLWENHILNQYKSWRVFLWLWLNCGFFQKQAVGHKQHHLFKTILPKIILFSIQFQREIWETIFSILKNWSSFTKSPFRITDINSITAILCKYGRKVFTASGVPSLKETAAVLLKSLEPPSSCITSYTIVCPNDSNSTKLLRCFPLRLWKCNLYSASGTEIVGVSRNQTKR